MGRLIASISEEGRILCDVCVWYDRKRDAVITVRMKGGIKYHVCEDCLDVALENGARRSGERIRNSKK